MIRNYHWLLVGLWVVQCGQGPKIPSIKHAASWRNQTCTKGLKSHPGTHHNNHDMLWKQFNNPTIDRLVMYALQHNCDINIARHRILESRALYGVATTSLLPKGGGMAQIQTGRNPGVLNQTNTVTAYKQTLETSWEIDVLGKNIRKIQSAKALDEAESALYEGVKKILILDIIQAYVDIQEKRQLFKLFKGLDRQYQQEIHLQFQKDKAGLELSNALETTQIQQVFVQNAMADVGHQLETGKNRLAVLLGCLPQQVDGLLGQDDQFPVLQHHILVGQPMAVIQKRYDVQVAYQKLLACRYQYASQIAQLFPSLTLSASMGQEKLNHKGYEKNWGLGLQLFQPLFELLALNQERKAQYQRTQQAIFEYKKTILKAYEDVENALHNYQTKRSQAELIHKQYRLQQSLSDQNRALNQQGLNSSIDVIQSEKNFIQSKQQKITAQAQIIEAQLQLLKAL